MAVRRVETAAEMAALADDARRLGKTLSFVPTMGALHAGHASLLTLARRRADISVLSIFVNPLQFGPKEDLSRYPRTPEADLARAEAARVDYLYAPAPAAMYPPGFQTTVTVAELEQPMDGAARPGHFRGVATVVLKLFAAVRPHLAIFGMKDYQQLQIIRRMTRDLDLGIEIVGAPIVRDPDGLALSSRNAYLSEEGRAQALALSRGLRAAEARFKAGERKAGPLLAATRTELAALETDYVDLRDAESLQVVSHVTAPVVLAVAARVGTTRLIDNIVLTP